MKRISMNSRLAAIQLCFGARTACFPVAANLACCIRRPKLSCMFVFAPRAAARSGAARRRNYRLRSGCYEWLTLNSGSMGKIFIDAGQRSCAAVTIFDAHDVIFAEIAAGLYFDKFERHLSRVFERVHDAYWNIG